MIRIMIVDDMPIFLEYLRTCINWNAYGFEICCEAQDGQQAWEQIQALQPDVVLTDIMMPYIDGIGLTERIVKNYPDIAVVLITGNDEFEYARRALKLGCRDYIVKPFEKEELIVTLLKLQDNIKKVKEQREKDELLELQRKSEIERALLYGNDQLKREKILQAMGMKKTNFLVCGIRFFSNVSNDYEQLMLWKDFIIKMLKDKILIDGQHAIFPDYENNIIILLNFNHHEELLDYKTHDFLDMMQVLKGQLQVECSVAISQEGQAGDIRNLYLNVLETLSCSCAGVIYDCRESREDGKTEFHTSLNETVLNYILNFNEALSRRNMDAVISIIETLWQQIGNTQPRVYLNFINSVFGILMTDIVNKGYHVEAVLDQQKDFINIWNSDFNVLSKKTNILGLLEKWIGIERKKSETRSSRITTATKQYIAEHYHDCQLSVSEIAKELLINQTDLRKMFKEETSMTISEYLVKYRMEKAKELILHTDEKLAVIAEKVGYSDVSYFSNCFKKYYGISPRNIAP